MSREADGQDVLPVADWPREPQQGQVKPVRLRDPVLEIWVDGLVDDSQDLLRERFNVVSRILCVIFPQINCDVLQPSPGNKFNFTIT